VRGSPRLNSATRTSSQGETPSPAPKDAPMDDLNFVNTLAYLSLGAALLPAVFFSAKYADTHINPPEPKPFALFLFGVLSVIAGLALIYVAFSGVHSGTVDCPMKQCSVSFSRDKALPYWIFVAMWWSFGVLAIGMGVALVGKAASDR
jgi:hypothetical protein